jgi:flagellar biosynthesis regulator FlaF
MMREAEQLRREQPASLDGLIEVSTAIRDGLN